MQIYKKFKKHYLIFYDEVCLFDFSDERGEELFKTSNNIRYTTIESNFWKEPLLLNSYIYLTILFKKDKFLTITYILFLILLKGKEIYAGLDTKWYPYFVLCGFV